MTQKVVKVGLVCIAGLAGLGALAASLFLTQNNLYQANSTGEFLSYEVPQGLANAVVSTSSLPDGRKQLSIAFTEELNTDQKILVEAFYGASFERAVIASVGGVTYESSPSIANNSAGVVDTTTFAKIDSAELTTTSSGITIKFPSSSIGTEDLMVVQIRSVPHEVAPTEILGGLSGIFSHVIYRNPALDVNGESTIILPKIPNGSGAVSGDGGGAIGGASSFFLNENIPWYNDFEEWDIDFEASYEPQHQLNQRPRDITPPNWGPPVGIWQPAPLILPVTDLDGDGLKDDFVLPGKDIVPGSSNLVFQGITANNKAILFILWKDLDGDGICDRNEIIALVGECIFPRGQNETKIYKENGHRIVQTINRNLGGPFKGVPTGGGIVYQYDVETGQLKVYIFDNLGRPMGLDSNGNAYVLPGNPGPTPVYQGPPSGYPGWEYGDQVYN